MTRRPILGVAIIAVALAACSMNPQHFVGPAGGDAFTLDCSWHGWTECYRKVAELCPRGYEIVQQSTTQYNGTTDTAMLAAECVDTPRGLIARD